MKLDRLLGIIIHLLNHENVSASRLAERFQVSVRTIQRDIISISSAGIPVYSVNGRFGGYSILPAYKMKNIDIRSGEQQMIARALESLATSYSNDALDTLIEKYNAIIEREGGQKVFWDFSVARENKRVQDLNALLESAISDRKCVAFDYRNADGRRSRPHVEPLAIHYKWYAWYLFAYSLERREYRTFKVARMQNPEVTERSSRIEHGDVERRMQESEQAYYRTCIDIEVHFSAEDAPLMEEYFPDCPIEELAEDARRTFIRVPARERLWKALLLSFGDRVKVVGPEDYRGELIETARKFLSNYDIQLSREAAKM